MWNDIIMIICLLSHIAVIIYMAYSLGKNIKK